MKFISIVCLLSLFGCSQPTRDLPQEEQEVYQEIKGISIINDKDPYNYINLVSFIVHSKDTIEVITYIDPLDGFNFLTITNHILKISNNVISVESTNRIEVNLKEDNDYVCLCIAPVPGCFW